MTESWPASRSAKALLRALSRHRGSGLLCTPSPPLPGDPARTRAELSAAKWQPPAPTPTSGFALRVKFTRASGTPQERDALRNFPDGMVRGDAPWIARAIAFLARWTNGDVYRAGQWFALATSCLFVFPLFFYTGRHRVARGRAGRGADRNIERGAHQPHLGLLGRYRRGKSLRAVLDLLDLFSVRPASVLPHPARSGGIGGRICGSLRRVVLQGGLLPGARGRLRRLSHRAEISNPASGAADGCLLRVRQSGEPEWVRIAPLEHDREVRPAHLCG